MRQHTPQDAEPPLRAINVLSYLLLLPAFSTTMMSPALPEMASSFGVSSALMQLAITLYIVCTSPMQFAAGVLADYWGYRRTIYALLAVFILSSIGCLLTDTFWVFITFRCLQAAVAGLATVARAKIRSLSDDAGAASAIGYSMIFVSFASMVGPPLGGYLIDHMGASFIFAFLIGLSLVMFPLVAAALPAADHGNSDAGSFQSREILKSLVRSTTFLKYSAIAAITSSVFFLYLSASAFVSESVFAINGTRLGFYLALNPLGYMVGNFLSGKWSRRLGIEKMISIGSGLSMCALIVLFGLTQILSVQAPMFFLLMFFLGVGNGMTLPSAQAALMGATTEFIGSASGLSSAIIVGVGGGVSAISSALVTSYSSISLMVFVMLASCSTMFFMVRYKGNNP